MTIATILSHSYIWRSIIMAKFVCPVCGYVLEADSIPAGFVCPQCKVPGEKFRKEETGSWASEHVVGICR